MKKNIKWVIILVFVFILCSSIAYAAVTGTLNITGYATTGTTVKLEIVDAIVISPRVGESVAYTDLNRDAIRMNLYLGYPGDERTVQFYIINTGNTFGRMQTWQNTLPGVAGLDITFPNLQGTVIMPGGQKHGPYSITVKWNTSNMQLPSGNYNFTGRIGYSN